MITRASRATASQVARLAVVPGATPNPARESRATGARAFTLVEMLVAVAVVAILTIGIGQIFGSVSKLVGTGAAVAEVDQAARTVEAQLRDDFTALSAMRADETFIAIRNTRLGDSNLDGDDTDPGEIDLYRTRDDEQADQRANLSPYERGPNNAKRSRAVTVRLDEITFIGQSNKGYQSYQGGDATGLANYALISLGHALRPPIQSKSDAAPYEPRRLNYADGYFGSHAGDANPFAPGGEDATGRNRYASNFVLSRQALVLYGPNALGYENPNSPPPLGYETEIAMYVRDLENSQILFGGPTQPDDLNRWPLGAVAPTRGFLGRSGYSVCNNTVVRHGRTDICAMGRDDVQRWFEGGISATTSDGSPWSSGLPYEIAASGLPILNRPLWYRFIKPPYAGSAKDSYLANLRGIQSAIAGTLCRKLVETEPPDLRFEEGAYAAPFPDPRDRRMDVHAILAEHCSSFEVAWSDGSRWDGGNNGSTPLIVDLDGDGRGLAPNEREILPGDVIWFDMDFTVRDLWDGRGSWGGLGSNVRRNDARYPRPNPDPEMGLEDTRVFDTLPPANSSGAPISVAPRTLVTSTALNVVEAQNFISGAYSRTFTQGREKADAEQEYLAIWGFNPPVGYDRDYLNPIASSGEKGSIAGDYVRDVPWSKPKLIRIRMTLNDSQNRLSGGKTFEFIFKVNLK